MHYLLIGAVLGLTAGFSPGPLQALVIAETLQHNMRAGLKVALSPLLTDVPIVIAALLLIRGISDSDLLLGLIALGGGGFLLLLGGQNLLLVKLPQQSVAGVPKSLLKGVLTNFLSPHPYLFWIGVGVPTMTAALAESRLAGVLFIVGFYGCLIGAKMFLVLLTGQSKAFISGTFYLLLLRILGLLILGLAAGLFFEAFKLLGLTS
ncbi:LysE family transporter [Pelobacter seleniigenes]|uniref:LysE family transporter n=1 Tax=Pelobacter seleniigenes TaxID=407188 RepID=UPI0004A6CB1E|nr:LysE family transporter [Pelobacter seleniigenes]